MWAICGLPSLCYVPCFVCKSSSSSHPFTAPNAEPLPTRAMLVFSTFSSCFCFLQGSSITLHLIICLCLRSQAIKRRLGASFWHNPFPKMPKITLRFLFFNFVLFAYSAHSDLCVWGGAGKEREESDDLFSLYLTRLKVE